MSTSSIDVTIIIPNWNGEKWLPGCLNALRKQKFKNFKTLVVDNGSKDTSRTILENLFPWVDTIYLPNNQGFAYAVNVGIQTAETEYIILLNNDTIPSEDWVFNLYRAIYSEPPETASLASCMMMMDNPNLIDDAGDVLTWYGSAQKRGHGKPKEKYSHQTEVFSACAGAALFRRSALLKVGLFDERFESYLEDIDVGLRLHLAGYRCMYIPDAVVLHKGHGSGIIKKNYIINMTRNRLLIYLKNIPLPLLIRNILYLIAGQIWYLLAYNNLSASLAGYKSIICILPGVIRDHHAIQKKRKITCKQIQRILTHNNTEQQ